LAQYEREKAVLEADEARRERDAMAIAVKPPQAKRVEINPEQPQTLWQTEVVPALPQREAAIGTNLFGTATTSSIDKLDALDDDGMITFERQDVEAQISGKTCDQVKREIAALTEHRRSNGMPISFLLFEELNAMQAFACDRKLATYPPRDN
jgi:ribosome maturation protein Sdo1